MFFEIFSCSLNVLCFMFVWFNALIFKRFQKIVSKLHWLKLFTKLALIFMFVKLNPFEYHIQSIYQGLLSSDHDDFEHLPKIFFLQLQYDPGEVHIVKRTSTRSCWGKGHKVWNIAAMSVPISLSLSDIRNDFFPFCHFLCVTYAPAAARWHKV